MAILSMFTSKLPEDNPHHTNQPTRLSSTHQTAPAPRWPCCGGHCSSATLGLYLPVKNRKEHPSFSASKTNQFTHISNSKYSKSCQTSSKFRQKKSTISSSVLLIFMANSAGGVSVFYPRCPVPSIFNACLVMAMVAAATPMKVGTEILRG